MESGAKQKRDSTATAALTGHVLLIATEELGGATVIEELRRELREANAEKLMVIAPAVERSPLHHALGDVNTARREAEKRLAASLAELRRAGIAALGEVGDSDPLVAAKDALRQFGADEVLIVAHAEDQARWFEDDLFERARTELHPTVRLITLRREGDDAEPRLAGVEESGPGRDRPAGAEHEVTLSQNLPQFTRGGLAGIAIAVVGTIVAIVLAATGPGSESAGGAAQILIAMGVALINMTHVVGLTLQESVHYRGGWQRFFRNLSLVATPAAIVANALISLLS